MSLMPIQKPDFVEAISQHKEELRTMMEWARQWLRLAESYVAGLDALEVEGGGAAIAADAFSGLQGLAAVVAYLNMEKRPRTRHQIAKALIKGGYKAGTGKRSEDVINVVIGSNVTSGKLKEPANKQSRRPDPNSLVGLPDWPDEWFTA